LLSRELQQASPCAASDDGDLVWENQKLPPTLSDRDAL